MYSIEQVTNNARQKQTLLLQDGTQITLSLYFVPMQLGWFIPLISYQGFTLNGLRITNSPNMLHQFRNQIPFGLACFSVADREPSQQDDFLSGASKLYLLSQEECTQYARFLSGEQI